MIFFECISFCLMVLLCAICTISDFRSGVIRNKVIFAFMLSAIALDVIYYGFYAGDLFFDFLINVVAVSLVCSYLFFSRSFAGGDCKMAVALALLFPARCYFVYLGSSYTLVLAIAFAIFVGYCYMLLNSVWLIIRKKTRMSLEYIKKSFKAFLKKYIITIMYISLLNSVVLLLANRGIYIHIWIIRLMCFGVALSVGRYPILQNKLMFLPVTSIAIIISVATKQDLFSINIDNLTFVLCLMFCQMAINTNIYEKVTVEQLKKGMILTTMSSIVMQSSITKGLPGISTEDLKSRLTQEEVESIKIWAKATHTESLTIVKKVPFAIFISSGYFLYCLLWVISK